MDVRTLAPADLEVASGLLHGAFARAAGRHGFDPPWADATAAEAHLAQCLAASPALTVVAEEGGAVVGVATGRVRGEVATVGPLAAAADGHGIGGALLDEVLERADAAGAMAARLYIDARNPAAFALYAGRGFSVVDTVAHIERGTGATPPAAVSRGLEITAVSPADQGDLARFDHMLTGHERAEDLASTVRLVARRKGRLVGYLGGAGATLGPAVAVDLADLVLLVGRAVAEVDAPRVRARLSTAAPTAATAMLGLGFRVRELGVVMSRGALPPARPPQLYGLAPEIL